ncbi:hypothetical protein CYMTET_22811 [Cymbomonas tetramitiformis]|uniref:Uncharacterized protein n=1 Tax=Cymbomonas tetramitiformis TaxID=36881 RepID=A0AAE0FZ59_9CHLO|nr:hypothetical protein CYMTET_22811 [Cymbomonas tetramitiformis]
MVLLNCPSGGGWWAAESRCRPLQAAPAVWESFLHDTVAATVDSDTVIETVSNLDGGDPTMLVDLENQTVVEALMVRSMQYLPEGVTVNITEEMWHAAAASVVELNVLMDSLRTQESSASSTVPVRSAALGRTAYGEIADDLAEMANQEISVAEYLQRQLDEVEKTDLNGLYPPLPPKMPPSPYDVNVNTEPASDDIGVMKRWQVMIIVSCACGVVLVGFAFYVRYAVFKQRKDSGLDRLGGSASKRHKKSVVGRGMPLISRSLSRKIEEDGRSSSSVPLMKWDAPSKRWVAQDEYSASQDGHIEDEVAKAVEKKAAEAARAAETEERKNIARPNPSAPKGEMYGAYNPVYEDDNGPSSSQQLPPRPSSASGSGRPGSARSSSGGEAGPSAPGAPGSKPGEFRRKFQPLDPAVVSKMSMNELMQNMERRGIPYKDCSSTDQLRNRLITHACMGAALRSQPRNVVPAIIQQRTLESPDNWFVTKQEMVDKATTRGRIRSQRRDDRKTRKGRGADEEL